MGDTGGGDDDEAARTNTGLRRLGVTYCFRFGFGLILIFFGAVASGYRQGMYSNGTPYFLGAFLTGIAMSILGVVNFRYWRTIIRGKASLSQKTQCFRIEIVICALSMICGLAGIIIASVNGVKTPECQSLFGSCSKRIYQQSNTYKFAVAILIMLISSLVMNMFYIWIHWNTFRQDDINPCSCVKLKHSPNSRHQTASQRNATCHASHVVINYRHGQPEPFGGVVLSHPSTNNNDTRHSGSGSTGVVLSTRHGQTEPFDGVVLDHPPTNNNQTIRGSTGDVLSTRHGQPEPFDGVVMSRPTTNENIAAQGNANLVSELHEQNRLPREQLAVQQQQLEQQEHQQQRHQHHQRQRRRQPQQHPVPSAPLLDTPPSYESCIANPSKK